VIAASSCSTAAQAIPTPGAIRGNLILDGVLRNWVSSCGTFYKLALPTITR
jgi:hypothetical protein